MSDDDYNWVGVGIAQVAVIVRRNQQQHNSSIAPPAIVLCNSWNYSQIFAFLVLLLSSSSQLRRNQILQHFWSTGTWPSTFRTVWTAPRAAGGSIGSSFQFPLGAKSVTTSNSKILSTSKKKSLFDFTENFCFWKNLEQCVCFIAERRQTTIIG